MSMWQLLDDESETHGSEVPGIGVIITAPGYGMCFVPGARIWKGAIVRDVRNAPPLVGQGKSAAEIRASQPLVVDEGALSYIVDSDTPEY